MGCGHRCCGDGGWVKCQSSGGMFYSDLIKKTRSSLESPFAATSRV